MPEPAEPAESAGPTCGRVPHRGDLSLAQEPYNSPDAQALVLAMAQDLTPLYGPGTYPHLPDAAWTPPAGYFVVARLGGAPVGCGGWLCLDERCLGERCLDERCLDERCLGEQSVGERCVELKRLFVRPVARGQGVARAVLADLERAAVAAGAVRAVLETGVRSEAALRLYRGTGWTTTPCWPPHHTDPESVCLQRRLGRTSTGPG